MAVGQRKPRLVEWQMTIDAIRRKTPEEFRAAVDGFDRRYVGDWDAWLAMEPRAKAAMICPPPASNRPVPVARNFT